MSEASEAARAQREAEKESRRIAKEAADNAQKEADYNRRMAERDARIALTETNRVTADKNKYDWSTWIAEQHKLRNPTPAVTTPTVTTTPVATTTPIVDSGIDMNKLMTDRLAGNNNIQPFNPNDVSAIMPLINQAYAPAEQRAREALSQTYANRGLLTAVKGAEGTGGQFRRGSEVLESELAATKTAKAMDVAQKIHDEKLAISQDAYNKAFQTSERLGTQSFATSERVATQEWTTNETKAAQDYQTMVTKAKSGYIDTDGNFVYGTDAALSKIENDWSTAQIELKAAINEKAADKEAALRKEITQMEQAYLNMRQEKDLEAKKAEAEGGLAGDLFKGVLNLAGLPI